MGKQHPDVARYAYLKRCATPLTAAGAAVAENAPEGQARWWVLLRNAIGETFDSAIDNAMAEETHTGKLPKRD